MGRCLLIEPNHESALNEEAGRLFMEDYKVCVCVFVFVFVRVSIRVCMRLSMRSVFCVCVYVSMSTRDAADEEDLNPEPRTLNPSRPPPISCSSSSPKEGPG